MFERGYILVIMMRSPLFPFVLFHHCNLDLVPCSSVSVKAILLYRGKQKSISDVHSDLSQALPIESALAVLTLGDVPC